MKQSSLFFLEEKEKVQETRRGFEAPQGGKEGGEGR
jgi:hypothetical protein